MPTLQEIDAEIARRQKIAQAGVIAQPEIAPVQTLSIDAIDAEITRRQQSAEPSFFDNLSTDLAERNKAIQETMAAERAGEIGKLEGTVQAFGQVAGGGIDVIGEGLAAAGRGVAAITPEFIKQPIIETAKEAFDYIEKSDIGGAAIDAIKGGVETYQEWAAENQQDAKTLGSAVNIGMVMVPLKGAPKPKTTPVAVPKTALDTVLEKGTVLTSDIKPPTTFVGKAFQKMSERVPVLGTGKVRAAQQASRKQAIDDIAREFDIDPSSAFEQEIVKGVSRVFKGAQAKGAKFRKEAIVELNKLGSVAPKAAIKEIDDQIAKVTALGAQGDPALIKSLQNIKGELSGNFERLKDIRTTIFQDIKDIGGNKSVIKSGGDDVLTKVAGSLSKDLDDFAVSAGKVEGVTKEMRQAANKWKASNRIFKDNFTKAKETELKRAMTKGKVQPEVVNLTIKGGKKSELSRLHGNLDEPGRRSVRQQILKNTLERAGWPENPNPTIFLNELNRMNNKKAVDVFFRGSDRRQLDGFKKFLDMTRRAQEEAASIATQQEVTGAALIGSAAVDPVTTISLGTLIGLGGRAYESKAVRNLLIELSKPKISPKKAKTITDKIRTLIPVAGASVSQATEEEK